LKGFSLSFQEHFAGLQEDFADFAGADEIAVGSTDPNWSQGLIPHSLFQIGVWEDHNNNHLEVIQDPTQESVEKSKNDWVMVDEGDLGFSTNKFWYVDFEHDWEVFNEDTESLKNGLSSFTDFWRFRGFIKAIRRRIETENNDQVVFNDKNKNLEALGDTRKSSTSERLSLKDVLMKNYFEINDLAHKLREEIFFL